MHEFELIKLIQTIQNEYTFQVNNYIATGIGDDCASLHIPDNQELLISTDTLVDNVHFNQQLTAREIGHKALAVNLSDIAAMGAKPIAVTLNLSLPNIDQMWITAFLQGFFKLAQQHQVTLIGGDTTKGPLSISISVYGVAEKNKLIKRSSAQINDLIYVSGALGEAAFILQHEPQDKTALHMPQPHIALGLALQGIANAMIDISDGLSSDLLHILKASHKGAIIDADKIPLGFQLQQALDKKQALSLALNGGEDYVLCFTVSKNKQTEVEKLKQQFPEITKIGMITTGQELMITQDNERHIITAQGYNHFNG